MEKNNPESAVVFRNVGQRYFPETRVECHYSLTSSHQWSSRDWVGIFKVGWSSLREYHTYSWSLVPEGYTERSAVNCCSLFQAFYLPRPSTAEYHFVYVDKIGQVCSQSRPFTFCAPKPLDELETLSEERNEEEEGDDEDVEELLLVVPRAQLLQSQLEECLKEKAQLQQAVQEARQEIEAERTGNIKAKEEWESERDDLKEEIEQLRQNLTRKCDALKKMEGKHQDVKSCQENLNSELSHFTAEKEHSRQQIKDFENKITALTDREKERNVEIERMKEKLDGILMKLSGQNKRDEKKKLLLAEYEALQSEEASEREIEGLHRQLWMGLPSLKPAVEKLFLRRDFANSPEEREALRDMPQKLEELRIELKMKEVPLREYITWNEKLQSFGERTVITDQHGDTKQVMLPGLADPVSSELTGSIMW